MQIRWLVLVLLNIGLIGSYYCYDIPTAIELTLSQKRFKDMSSAEFQTNYNLLYSLYSWPNVLLPLFGGYISDYLGVRLTNMVFSGLVALGQVIFGIGLNLMNDSAAWGVMFAGRIVFGFGGESLSVTMSALIARWFSGKELALALGTNLALARVGSVINDKASSALAEKYNVGMAGYVGIGVCLLSFVAAVLVFYIDRNAADEIKANRRTERAGLRAAAAREEAEREAAERGVVLSAADSEAAAAAGAEEEDEGDGGADEVVDFSAILKLPYTFWVLSISCVTVYAAILPFNNIASSLVHVRYHVSNNEATTLLLILYLVAGCLSPFLGAVIDAVGHRASLAVVASGLIVGCHLFLGLAPSSITPIGALVVLGICYAIYAAALWPSIAIVTPEKYHGTAYGLVTAVQNLGLAVMPLVVGKLTSECPTTYTCVELAFATMGGVGTAAGVWLLIVNAMSKPSLLNLPQSKIEAIMKEQARREREGDDDDDDGEGGLHRMLRDAEGSRVPYDAAGSPAGVSLLTADMSPDGDAPTIQSRGGGTVGDAVLPPSTY